MSAGTTAIGLVTVGCIYADITGRCLLTVPGRKWPSKCACDVEGNE